MSLITRSNHGGFIIRKSRPGPHLGAYLGSQVATQVGAQGRSKSAPGRLRCCSGKPARVRRSAPSRHEESGKPRRLMRPAPSRHEGRFREVSTMPCPRGDRGCADPQQGGLGAQRRVPSSCCLCSPENCCNSRRTQLMLKMGSLAALALLLLLCFYQRF